MKKNSNNEKHLSRQQLLQAARGEDGSFEHLKTCRSCRQATALLREYRVAGNQYLTDAPDFLINRVIAIAGGSPAAKGARKWLAEIIFDSWSMPHPIGVRGVESLDHRRLRFNADHITVDLRAERLKSEWDFTARVSGRGIKDTPPLLLAGTKSIAPDPNGFYVWKSKRPPKKLLLHIGGAVFELPELSWKKPRAT